MTEKTHDDLEKLKDELISVLFVKWDKDGLKKELVVTTKDKLPEVRRKYRKWIEAKPVGRKCPKCDSDLLNYGMVNTTDGIFQIIRCGSDKCDHVETVLKYTPEQVEALRILTTPTKHCGKVMKPNWKYCPYCGEQL